jgi:hypothetical protein
MSIYESMRRDADGHRYYRLPGPQGAYKAGDRHPSDPWAVCKGASKPDARGWVVFLFDTLPLESDTPVERAATGRAGRVE